VDETYVKVKGIWTYLYRALDSLGQTIDFLLAPRRDAAAAKRFFRKALAQAHTVNPRTITVDKNPGYPRAAAEMKRTGELWRCSHLRQCKHLNKIVEQDHRRIKRLVRPGLGFGSLRTARRTLAGYEAMAMIRKGQVHNVGGHDIYAQSAFGSQPLSGGRLKASASRLAPACPDSEFATEPQGSPSSDINELDILGPCKGVPVRRLFTTSLHHQNSASNLPSPPHRFDLNRSRKRSSKIVGRRRRRGELRTCP